MITKNELKFIDTTYFEVLHMGCYAVYLRSKCTGHYWALVYEECRNARHYRLYHKHRQNSEYHRHSDCKNFKVAIEERIKPHDEFVLNGRKSVERPHLLGLCSKE